MKWIGQHIWSLISRFRNDVYLESITESAQDHIVGIDADGKLYKQDVSAGDITGVTAGTGLSGGGSSGDVTLNVDASQTQITSVGTIVTGEWRGTAVASAYLDSDTAHLSGVQSFTGAKTFEAGIILDGNRSVAASGDGVAMHLDAMDITNATTSASGTASFYNHIVLENPRVLALNPSVTTSEASTLYIKGAPAASTNQTIVRTYALNVAGGDVKLGADLQVGGIITAKQRHVMNCGFNVGSSGKKYLPFGYGGTFESTSTSNVGEFIAFTAPCNGYLDYCVLRTEGTPGSTTMALHLASDGTEVPSTTATHTTAAIDMSTDDISTKFSFGSTDGAFTAGQVIVIGADFSSACFDTWCTAVLVLDWNNEIS